MQNIHNRQEYCKGPPPDSAGLENCADCIASACSWTRKQQSVLASRSRGRSSSAADKRYARLVLEIQSFAFDDQRTVMDLCVDVPNVLSNNSHKEKLERP